MNSKNNENAEIVSILLRDDLAAAIEKYEKYFNISNKSYKGKEKKRKENYMYFNVDEQTIIKMYLKESKTKEVFLVDITRGLASTNDKDMLKLMLSVVKKVRKMTDSEFEKIDLSKAMDFSDED